jgi:hypothetical protein
MSKSKEEINNFLIEEYNKLVHCSEFPTKLYNIETSKIERSKESSNIQNYAILSYV